VFYFISKCSSNGENDEEETAIRRHPTIKHAKEKSRGCNRLVVKEHDQQPKACYKSFSELRQRITGLKTLKGWKFKTMADRLIMKKTVEPFLLPEVEITCMIDDSLAYTVKAFGCYLPEDHPLYVTHRRSVRNISVCENVRELECYKLCCGVEASELTSQLFHHVIPINVDSLQACEQGEQFPNKGFWRSKDCHLMCEKVKIHAYNVWSTWFPQERP